MGLISRIPPGTHTWPAFIALPSAQQLDCALTGSGGAWDISQWRSRPGEATGKAPQTNCALMVMKLENRRPDGTLTVSRLTFYDITDESYEWKGEQVVGEQATATWTSSCKRRK